MVSRCHAVNYVNFLENSVKYPFSVDIVEVGSSILPSPTKAYSIPDKESDKPFSLPKTLKTGVGTKLGTEDSENSSANVSLGWIIVRLTSPVQEISRETLSS